MKTAIQIIKEAYENLGMSPSGLPLKGKFAEDGLNFLNEVIYRLNSDNYFPFTNNTIDGHVKGGSATISPDFMSEFVGENPISITKVLLKYGNEWIPLVNVGYGNIWERRSGSSRPMFYSFSNDEEGRGILTFDCENGDFDCRVIYNKNIPAMDFNDELMAPPQYEQLLKYGVCLKICNRHNLPAERKEGIKEDYNSILDAIKKNNSYKHEIDRPYVEDENYFNDYSLQVLMGRHL